MTMIKEICILYIVLIIPKKKGPTVNQTGPFVFKIDTLNYAVGALHEAGLH